MTPRRSLLAAVLVAAGVTIALGILTRREDVVPPAPAVIAPAPATIDLHGTTLVLRHQGQKQAEVRAGRVEVSGDLRYAAFQDIARAILYDRGKPALSVRANEIVLDRQTSDLRARGGLVLTAPHGYRLTAPEGVWVAARRQLIFSAGMTIRGPDSVIQARYLVVDVGLQSFVLEGSVDMTFRLSGGTP